MSNKIMFVTLAIFVCLGLSPAPASARSSRMLFSSNDGLTGDALIAKACAGVGVAEPECKETLKAAPDMQKHHYVELAFYGLRFIEDTAANLSATFKKDITTNHDIGPGLQSALAECLEQFTSLDDLVEDSINAMLAFQYGDTTEFLEAGISSLDMCSDQLEETIKVAGEGPGPDAQIARVLNLQNVFIKAMMNAGINLIKDQTPVELPAAN